MDTVVAGVELGVGFTEQRAPAVFAARVLLFGPDVVAAQLALAARRRHLLAGPIDAAHGPRCGLQRLLAGLTAAAAAAQGAAEQQQSLVELHLPPESGRREPGRPLARVLCSRSWRRPRALESLRSACGSSERAIECS